jgi:hypothetical protein
VKRKRSIGTGWLAAAIVLALGCATPVVPAASSESDRPAAAAVSATATAADSIADLAAAEAALGGVLQPRSLDLLPLIAAEETIEATLDVTEPKRVAALAIVQGLSATEVSGESVLVTGPRNDVVIFAAGVRATSAVVMEDHRVDRWLPTEAPSVQAPHAGRPYLVAPLIVDRSVLQMNEDLQPALLSELARTIETFDGRPYDRIHVYGECNGRPPSCDLSAQGSQGAAGGREDQYLIVSDASTANQPRLASTIREAVPRSFARAAEWIARHDVDAARTIAGYDTCCYAQWNPGQPGRIGLVYARSCGTAVFPTRRKLAATGDCFDIVTIVVDLGTATIVSITPNSGPSGG